MCSRFEVNACSNQLSHRFGLKELPCGYSTGEVFPTNQILCFNSSGVFLNVWGLKVDWSKTPLINARSETLAKTRAFRPLLENRCIIPATAYFEWRRTSVGPLKNKIAVTGLEIFGLAGLTDGHHVVVLTCNPAPSIAHIHGRMPVILSGKNEKSWINKDETTQTLLTKLEPKRESQLFWREEKARQGDLFSRPY